MAESVQTRTGALGEPVTMATRSIPFSNSQNGKDGIYWRFTQRRLVQVGPISKTLNDNSDTDRTWYALTSIVPAAEHFYTVGLDDTESLAGDDREVQIKLRIKIGCPRVPVSFKYFPAVRELTSSLRYSPTSLQTS